MTATIRRRLEALEGRHEGNGQPLLIVVRFIDPARPYAEPLGIEAAPPHLAAVDRLPAESWDAFMARLRGMLTRLQVGAAVVALAREGVVR